MRVSMDFSALLVIALGVWAIGVLMGGWVARRRK